MTIYLQKCEDSNHFLCGLRPIPFSESPRLACNFCCANRNATCFENMSKGITTFSYQLKWNKHKYVGATNVVM